MCCSGPRGDAVIGKKSQVSHFRRDGSLDGDAARNKDSACECELQTWNPGPPHVEYIS